MLAIARSMRLGVGMIGAGLVALAGVAAVMPVASVSARPPEPSPVPKRWQLDFQASPLRLIFLPMPDGSRRAFFYFTYAVTNNSPSDVLFAPLFELATEEGVVIRAGRDVPLEVSRTIVDRLQSSVIQDQISIVGTLLRGEENSKEGLVIFAAPTLHMSELTIYAAGFSGETTTVDVPSVVPGEKERKVLRKTMEMKYRMEGDLAVRAPEPLQPSERRWIMR